MSDLEMAIQFGEVVTHDKYGNYIHDYPRLPFAF